jgi:23S rRNA (guanine745-N1)-methyltransferase
VLADVIELLRCPHCRGALALERSAVRCAQGHSFDVGRQGYVTLTSAAGDSAGMVAAREAFLGAGHYAPITDAVRRHVEADGPVVDLGAGTGHHLARVLGDDQVALALDSSRYALRRAARLERVGAVGADVWQDLPVRDGAAGTVLCVFSPRNGPEIARILRGNLIVVTPTRRHLRELVERHGLVGVDPLKRERLGAQLSLLRRTKEELIEFDLELAPTDANALVEMGPSAHHEHERVDEPVATVASVELTVWQR